MKIHSDVLTYSDVAGSAGTAGYVSFVKLDQVGSRSRQRAFNVILSGTSSYRTQWHDSAGEQAATWDEWGMFLAAVFDKDPNAHCGKHSYQSAEHFHWMTGDRFRNLTPSFQHKRHRWELVTDTPCFAGVLEWWCDCGATQRTVRQADVDWRDYVKAESR